VRKAGSGLSTAAAATVGLLVAVVIIGFTVATRLPAIEIYSNVAARGVAAVEQAAKLRLSLVYYVGDKIAISNDGDSPVRIVKLIVDGLEEPVDLYLKPGDVSGDIVVGYAVRDIAAVLEDGRIVPLLSHPEKVVYVTSIGTYACKITYETSTKTSTLTCCTTITETKTVTLTATSSGKTVTTSTTTTLTSTTSYYSTYWVKTTAVQDSTCTTTLTSTTTLKPGGGR